MVQPWLGRRKSSGDSPRVRSGVKGMIRTNPPRASFIGGTTALYETTRNSLTDGGYSASKSTSKGFPFIKLNCFFCKGLSKLSIGPNDFRSSFKT